MYKIELLRVKQIVGMKIVYFLAKLSGKTKAKILALIVFSGRASSFILRISNSEMLAKREFKLAILFCLDHALFTPSGVNNAQLLRHSEANCLKHHDH